MSSPPEPGTAEYEAYAAENKGPWILITCWLVTAVSTLFVIARVYVRGFMHGKLQQDDWWTIIAMVSLLCRSLLWPGQPGRGAGLGVGTTCLGSAERAEGNEELTGPERRFAVTSRRHSRH